jgi:hypothetical protein
MAVVKVTVLCCRWDFKLIFNNNKNVSIIDMFYKIMNFINWKTKKIMYVLDKWIQKYIIMSILLWD